MKRIYESFSEVAEDFVTGEYWTHSLSPHSSSECFGWQKGVQEFAKWLDSSGAKILENPEIYEKLWDMRSHPDQPKRDP